MESSGVITPKFLRVLSGNREAADWLRISFGFRRDYSDLVSDVTRVRFRTGYEIFVNYNKDTGSLSGFGKVFDDFNLQGGDMLLLEFDGDGGFNCHVIGKDYVEIDYPPILSDMQRGSSRKVTVRNGGYRFVSFVTPGLSLADGVDVPISFAQNCFGHRDCFVHYLVSNGKIYEGLLDKSALKFRGLESIFNEIGIPDVSTLNMFLMAYEDPGQIRLSFFDDNFVEYVFPGTPLSNGADPYYFQAAVRFEINVKPVHLDRYCHGIDISTDFKEVSNHWSRKDYIRVYTGNASWKLHVRHRPNWSRTTIHNGWMDFMTDNGLEVGDIFLFDCHRTSYHDFSFRLLKHR